MSLTTKKLNNIKKKLGRGSYYSEREMLRDSYDTINNYTHFKDGLLVKLTDDTFGIAYKHTQNRFNSFYSVLINDQVRVYKENQIKKFWI